MLLLIKNWVLKKVSIIKEQSIKLINEKSQTNRDQNRTLLFLQRHDQSQTFWLKLVKNRQKHYKGINIYHIGYIIIKKIDDCENIYGVNPLYLLVNHESGYINEKNWNTYLIFDDFVNENKALLKNYADVWDGIENKIKAIHGGENSNYEKDYVKIKFNSDDDFPLNKPLKFHAVTLIIRSAFEEGGKLYPKAFLDDALYEL